MGNIATQAYSQSGIIIPHRNNYSSNGLSSSEYSSKLADQYFRKLNDVPISPEAASKGIEIANAVALARCFPGPATLVNLATTIGESSQMLISKSDKLSKATKDGALAWFQILSGAAGFLGIGKEMIFRSDEENFQGVPLFEKLALTGSSILNIFSMISTSVEKSLISMVCWNKNDKETSSEHRTSLTSALADRRCIGESLVMATIPWISNVGIIKRFVDVSLSYSAIAEGLDTFEDHGKVLFLPDKYQSPFLQSVVKFISNPLSIFMSETPKNQKYNLCFPFNKIVRLLIGNENDAKGKGQSGVRNYMFKPMFEFLGCKPPLFYLDEKDNLVVEFLGEVSPCNKQEPVKPKVPDLPKQIAPVSSDRFAVSV